MCTGISEVLPSTLYKNISKTWDSTLQLLSTLSIGVMFQTGCMLLSWATKCDA